jgi:hypothetical protein
MRKGDGGAGAKADGEPRSLRVFYISGNISATAECLRAVKATQDQPGWRIQTA